MTGKRPKHIAIKLLAALTVFCAASLLLGKFGLTVTRYALSFERLPDGFEGFRIVQLSDLHGSEFGRDNRRLVSAVRKEAPDIIVMTGDFLDEGKNELAGVETLAGQLTEIAPVYFVSGNHDWASGEMDRLAEVLDGAGVTFLRNGYVPLERGGDSILLAGVEDPNGRADMTKPDALASAINDAYPDSFILLLGHRNYWAEKYPGLPVDLILCGHSHGGIVRLPGIGGVFGTGGDLFPEYDAGVFESGRYRMVVSRGLGNSVSAPRFMNTPELVTLILHTE